MYRQQQAVEITCSYLQSLDPVPFDDFCSALAATYDCVFHNRDDFSGIPFDTHGPDDSSARSSGNSDISADRIHLFYSSYFSRRVYWLYDIPWHCNIFDPLLVDCIKMCLCNEGR